jgi:hypothetical protein
VTKNHLFQEVGLGEIVSFGKRKTPKKSVRSIEWYLGQEENLESWETGGLLCLARFDDFQGSIVKLLESFKDVLGMNNMVNMGDDIGVATEQKELVYAYTGYWHELVCCERVTLRVEFLVE